MNVVFVKMVFPLLLVVAVATSGVDRKPQHETWYDGVLDHINPDNRNFGAAWDERKQEFIRQLGNPYFEYCLGATGALILLLTVTIAQYTSHRNALRLAAQSLADVLRHDQQSREVAHDAIRRYNEHIESCNRNIEADSKRLSVPNPGPSPEMQRLNQELLATREENKSLREDLDKKSRLIAEISLQLKKGHGAAAQIALDFVPPDYIARINELEKQLAAEKEKNQRQKGTPVDAHRG